MVALMEVGVSINLNILSNDLSSTGLLVAACVNRAPEGTFGAAVAEVGVLDMLKVSLLNPLGMSCTNNRIP